MSTAEILRSHYDTLYELIDDVERDLSDTTSHEAEAFLAALHQAIVIAEGAIAAEGDEDEEDEEEEEEDEEN